MQVPYSNQNYTRSLMLLTWGLLIPHHLNTHTHTSSANGQWNSMWLVSLSLELHCEHNMESKFKFLFWSAHLVGKLSRFSLHTKHITLIGTLWTHFMIISFGVLLGLLIFFLKASTLKALSNEMLQYWQSKLMVGWNTPILDTIMFRSRFWLSSHGLYFQSQLISPIFTMSLILQNFFCSNLYNSGNSALRFLSPHHLSCQNRVLSPALTFFLIILVMSIPFLVTISLTLAILFHTPVYAFLAIYSECLLDKLWIPLKTLLHNSFSPFFSRYHHLNIKDKLHARNDPKPRSPNSLGDTTFSYATQLIFFLFFQTTTKKTSSYFFQHIDDPTRCKKEREVVRGKAAKTDLLRSNLPPSDRVFAFHTLSLT